MEESAQRTELVAKVAKAPENEPLARLSNVRPDLPSNSQVKVAKSCPSTAPKVWMKFAGEVKSALLIVGKRAAQSLRACYPH